MVKDLVSLRGDWCATKPRNEFKLWPSLGPESVLDLRIGVCSFLEYPK